MYCLACCRGLQVISLFWGVVILVNNGFSDSCCFVLWSLKLAVSFAKINLYQ
jgi:hypothetical protein